MMRITLFKFTLEYYNYLKIPKNDEKSRFFNIFEKNYLYTYFITI
jgi:hypothetical protein